MSVVTHLHSAELFSLSFASQARRGDNGGRDRVTRFVFDVTRWSSKTSACEICCGPRVITPPAMRIGNAVLECAGAVRTAAIIEPYEVGGAEMADLAKWSQLPRQCEFKVEEVWHGHAKKKRRVCEA